MNYMEVKKDEYNFKFLLNLGEDKKIEIGKFKNNDILKYCFSACSENEFDSILNYFKNIFGIVNLNPVYHEESAFDEEIDCIITNNITSTFYLDTGDVIIKIVNDNVNEKKYDQLMVNMASNLQLTVNRGVTK